MKTCTLCNKYNAVVDGKTKKGHTALMCQACYLWHGVGMGVEKGQYINQEIEYIKEKQNEILTR